MKDGMVFYESKNKVVLSSGLGKVVERKYFKRVVDKNGKVLLNN